MDSPADDSQSTQMTVEAVEPEVIEVAPINTLETTIPELSAQLIESPSSPGQDETTPVVVSEPTPITDVSPEDTAVESEPVQPSAPQVEVPPPADPSEAIAPEPQAVPPAEIASPPVVAEQALNHDPVIGGLNQDPEPSALNTDEASQEEPLPAVTNEDKASDPQIEEQPEPPKPAVEQVNATVETPAGEYSPAVLALTDEELKSAMKLYLQKHHAERTRRGVQARQAKMNKNLDQVVSYISARPNSQIPRMARELNISPQLLSRYLQKLVKQGRVRAEGWQKNRRYLPGGGD